MLATVYKVHVSFSKVHVLSNDIFLRTLTHYNFFLLSSDIRYINRFFLLHFLVQKFPPNREVEVVCSQGQIIHLCCYFVNINIPSIFRLFVVVVVLKKEISVVL